VKKREGFPWYLLVLICFYVTCGALCGYLAADQLGLHMAGAEFSTFVLHIGILLVSMAIAMLAHTVIHELGHLLFGLLTGYRFCSFRVGRLMLVKVEGRLRLKHLTLTGTGGQCLMLPPAMKNGKIPVALYNLGGSILNFTVALICLLVFLVLPWMLFVSEFLLMSAVIGFAYALTNGIPMRMGFVDNDGYNAISLSRNPQAMRAWWIQLQANGKICQGVRIKDMPEEWFTVPDDEAMRNSITATLGVFACSRLMDEHRFLEADALMEKLLHMDAGIVGLHRSMMTCDRIYCELIGACDDKKLLALRDKTQRRFEKAMSKHPSVLRTQYAWALLYEKDRDTARKYRKCFSESERSYPYPCEMTAERELMQIARDRTNVV